MQSIPLHYSPKVCPETHTQRVIKHGHLIGLNLAEVQWQFIYSGTVKTKKTELKIDKGG